MSLKDLVKAAQRGDRDAFRELVGQCRERVEALLHARVGALIRGRVEIEDLAQETFVSAWHAIGAFTWKGEKAFWGWLSALAVRAVHLNARRMHAKKRAVRREVPLDGDFGGQGKGIEQLAGILRAHDATPSTVGRREERFERLKQAMHSLSPDYRKVVFLVCVRNIPIKEVARELGRSPGAVSMLLYRALRRLKEIFGTTESLSLPARPLFEDEHGEGQDRNR